jgi:hypothetical protein
VPAETGLFFEEETMMRKTLKLTIGAAIAAVFMVGISAFFSPVPAAAGRCICPQVYAPVKCSNGKTYPNLCVAGCQNAKNCVPTGDI